LKPLSLVEQVLRHHATVRKLWRKPFREKPPLRFFATAWGGSRGRGDVWCGTISEAALTRALPLTAASRLAYLYRVSPPRITAYRKSECGLVPAV